jgi:hypothetical protein
MLGKSRLVFRAVVRPIRQFVVVPISFTEFPVKYEMVLNRKTAKALGLAIPHR